MVTLYSMIAHLRSFHFTTLTIDDRDAKSLSLNWHAGLAGGAVAAMHDDAADVDPVGRDHHLAG